MYFFENQTSQIFFRTLNSSTLKARKICLKYGNFEHFLVPTHYDNQTSTTFSACAVQYLFHNKKLITALPLGLFAQQNSQQQ